MLFYKSFLQNFINLNFIWNTLDTNDLVSLLKFQSFNIAWGRGGESCFYVSSFSYYSYIHNTIRTSRRYSYCAHLQTIYIGLANNCLYMHHLTF